MRVYIGRKYEVPDGDGGTETGELVEASVNEDQMKVYGCYKVPSGDIAIIWTKITDDELALYRKSPDTFFKAPRKTRRKRPS